MVNQLNEINCDSIQLLAITTFCNNIILLLEQHKIEIKFSYFFSVTKVFRKMIIYSTLNDKRKYVFHENRNIIANRVGQIDDISLSNNCQIVVCFNRKLCFIE